MKTVLTGVKIKPNMKKIIIWSLIAVIVIFAGWKVYGMFAKNGQNHRSAKNRSCKERRADSKQ